MPEEVDANGTAAHGGALKDALVGLLPIYGWLPRYRWKWLRSDALAGLSVWALLVPQALAYATIAGVPVQYGLYTAFVALIAYVIFGTSRQMVVGPSAPVAAVTAAVIAPLVARVQPVIFDLWRRAGAIDAIGADHVFRTVREAVGSFDGAR